MAFTNTILRKYFQVESSGLRFLFYFNKKKTFSAKCDSEEDSSKEVDKSSEKKAALEKNGWTMVEKEDLSKVKQTSNQINKIIVFNLVKTHLNENKFLQVIIMCYVVKG